MLNQFVLIGEYVGIGANGESEVILQIDQDFYTVEISPSAWSELFQSYATKIALKGSIAVDDMNTYTLYATEVNILERKEVLGICVECFADLFAEDEILPDYAGIYQCSDCGHPNTVPTRSE